MEVLDTVVRLLGRVPTLSESLRLLLLLKLRPHLFVDVGDVEMCISAESVTIRTDETWVTHCMDRDASETVVNQLELYIAEKGRQIFQGAHGLT